MIEGDPPAELAVLSHGMRSPIPPELELRLRLHGDRSALRVVRRPLTGAADQADETRRTIPVVSGLDAATQAYGLVHGTLRDLAQRRGYAWLHAGLVDLPGGRVLVVGASGAGKTTLTLELAAHGLVGGDEAVLIAPDGSAIALPRRIHVKSSGAGLLRGELRERALELGYDPPILALDVAELWPAGTRPRLTAAPVDLVVFLADEPGEGELVDLDELSALRQLLVESDHFVGEPVAATRERLVRAASALVRSVPTVAVRARSAAGSAQAILDRLAR